MFLAFRHHVALEYGIASLWQEGVLGGLKSFSDTFARTSAVWSLQWGIGQWISPKFLAKESLGQGPSLGLSPDVESTLMNLVTSSTVLVLARFWNRERSQK